MLIRSFLDPFGRGVG